MQADWPLQEVAPDRGVHAPELQVISLPYCAALCGASAAVLLRSPDLFLVYPSTKIDAIPGGAQRFATRSQAAVAQKPLWPTHHSPRLTQPDVPHRPLLRAFRFPHPPDMEQAEAVESSNQPTPAEAVLGGAPAVAPSAPPASPPQQPMPVPVPVPTPMPVPVPPVTAPSTATPQPGPEAPPAAPPAISWASRVSQQAASGAAGELDSAGAGIGDGEALARSRGLQNQSGEYNCFVNVVIQCLWHLSFFR